MGQEAAMTVDPAFPRHDWTLAEVEALFALLDLKPMEPVAGAAAA